MFCPKCGKQLPEGTKFCTQCGQSLQTSSPAPEPAAAQAGALRLGPVNAESFPAVSVTFRYLAGESGAGGESRPFTYPYSNWTPGEPSRVDRDNTPERYIMLWYVRDRWAWNDQRNDPAAAVPGMAKSMGFACEYES